MKADGLRHIYLTVTFNPFRWMLSFFFDKDLSVLTFSIGPLRISIGGYFDYLEYAEKMSKEHAGQ